MGYTIYKIVYFKKYCLNYVIIFSLDFVGDRDLIQKTEVCQFYHVLIAFCDCIFNIIEIQAIFIMILRGCILSYETMI